jgi:hypothetical protein
VEVVDWEIKSPVVFVLRMDSGAGVVFESVTRLLSVLWFLVLLLRFFLFSSRILLLLVVFLYLALV